MPKNHINHHITITSYHTHTNNPLTQHTPKPTSTHPHNIITTLPHHAQVTPVEYYQELHIRVKLIDINDNPPTFPSLLLPLNISETTSIGSAIPIPSALDADAGINSQIAYSVTPSTYSSFFRIEVGTVCSGGRRCGVL